MSTEIISSTKFVTTSRVALFESFRDGIIRVWSQPLYSTQELTASKSAYVDHLFSVKLDSQ